MKMIIRRTDLPLILFAGLLPGDFNFFHINYLAIE
jgi:hypothetical protein